MCNRAAFESLQARQNVNAEMKIAKKTANKKNCRFSEESGGRKLSLALIKKGVNNLLFLTDKLLAVLEAIGFALDINDSAVVQDAV